MITQVPGLHNSKEFLDVARQTRMIAQVPGPTQQQRISRRRSTKRE